MYIKKKKKLIFVKHKRKKIKCKIFFRFKLEKKAVFISGIYKGYKEFDKIDVQFHIIQSRDLLYYISNALDAKRSTYILFRQCI